MTGKRDAVDDGRQALNESGNARTKFDLDGRLRRDDAFHRYRLRFAHLSAAEAEFGEQHFGDLVRVAQLVHLESRATLDYRAMKQVLRRRHRHQGRDFLSASGLAEDRYPARIAAELRDVAAHPVESRDQVQHSSVARLAEVAAADAG